MAKKQILTLKRLADLDEPKGCLFTGDIPKIHGLTPSSEEENPIARYELSRWGNHFEASLNIPDVSEEIYKLMAEGVNDDIKELKQKIWDYMKEHPTKDRGVIISPETHDLILEEVGYGDGVNACYMYAKEFHFEMKEEVWLKKWFGNGEVINEEK